MALRNLTGEFISLRSRSGAEKGSTSRYAFRSLGKEHDRSTAGLLEVIALPSCVCVVVIVSFRPKKIPFNLLSLSVVTGCCITRFHFCGSKN